MGGGGGGGEGGSGVAMVSEFVTKNRNLKKKFSEVGEDGLG